MLITTALSLALTAALVILLWRLHRAPVPSPRPARPTPSLPAPDPGPSSFTVKAAEARLRFAPDGATRIDYSIPTGGNLEMAPAGFLSGARRTRVTSDFDAEMAVRAGSETFVRRILLPDAREIVRELRALGFGPFAWPGLRIEIRPGRLTVEVSRRLPAETGELGEFLRLSRELAAIVASRGPRRTPAPPRSRRSAHPHLN